MTPQELIRRHDRLKADRSNFETQWQEIAELAFPARADFTVSRSPGERRGLQQYDSAAAVAAENLAAGLWGSITNSAVEWFYARHPEPSLNDDAGTARWMEGVTDRMRDAFAADGSRFYSRAYEFYRDLCTFGTALFYVDEAPGDKRLHFSNRSLAECLIDVDDRERVDTVIRRFSFTARQAVARWGDRANEAARVAVGTDPDKRLWYIHAVMPNDRLDKRKRDNRGKAFASLTVSVEDKAIVQEGGFDEFPYQVARWGTASRNLYGDSPAMLALADTKTLNVMQRTTLVAAQKAADPPLLAPDEGAIRGIRVVPGGITYGGVDAMGNPLVRPLVTGANFNLSEALSEQKRVAIREAFHATLLQMASRPNMTATEVLETKEERLRLMGPQLGRIESEFLDPLTRRVFSLLWRSGSFAEPPEALFQDARVQVEYVSPLSRAQRSGEAAAVLRATSAILPLAQVRPDIVDNLDFDQIARGIADGYGLPPRMMRDPKLVGEERQAKAEQAAAMQQMEMMAGAAAPVAQYAKGAKDLASAGLLPS